MKSLEEQTGEWCRHFTGLMDEACRAGIAYRTVRDESTAPYRFPCLRGDGVAARCPHVSYLTPEEVTARVAEINAALEKFVTNLAADICPHCETPIARRAQVGRCVYAEPCGHRLYQGRA